MKIWVCEIVGSKSESVVGRTKRDAETLVATARGYEPEDFRQCVKDGFVKRAVRYDVPDVVAAILLGD